MYGLDDLCYDTASMNKTMAAPANEFFTRYGWSVVNNASLVLGVFNFIDYGCAPTDRSG